MHRIIEKDNARKKIYFCFIDYAKAFDCVDHNKLWKSLKENGGLIRPPDHLTCLLRNVYTGKETTELDMENSAVATGLEKVSFHPNPKEG